MEQNNLNVHSTPYRWLWECHVRLHGVRYWRQSWMTINKCHSQVMQVGSPGKIVASLQKPICLKFWGLEGRLENPGSYSYSRFAARRVRNLNEGQWWIPRKRNCLAAVFTLYGILETLDESEFYDDKGRLISISNNISIKLGKDI